MRLEHPSRGPAASSCWMLAWLVTVTAATMAATAMLCVRQPYVARRRRAACALELISRRPALSP
jgi:hypothetical protein